jgi:hypothetical protein
MALIVFIGFVLTAIFLAIKHREGGPLILIVFGLFAAFIAGLAVDAPVAWATRSNKDISYNLAALNDSKNTRGSFFLGSGTIDSVPSFMFYAEDGDGYVLRSWDASSSRVVETDGKPHVVYHCDDYGTVPRPFRYPVKMILDDGWGWVDCRHASLTFYVPAGSVKQSYTLDAQ